MKILNKLVLASTALVSAVAMATPDELIASLKPVEQGVSTFTNWLYGLIAVIAILFVIFEGIRFWNGRITWLELFGNLMKVLVVAGAVVLVPWLWGLIK